MELPPEVIGWATAETRTWIEQQRRARRPEGMAIPTPVREVLGPFFAPATLDSVRVTIVPRIENPPFLAQARELGLPVQGIEFSKMQGLTVVDTVLISQAFPPEDQLRLLFHELVHVVQYEILGIEEFSGQYVRGIVENGFDYNRIPLEVMAYELDSRFAGNRAVGFSVSDEVQRRLA